MGGPRHIANDIKIIILEEVQFFWRVWSKIKMSGPESPIRGRDAIDGRVTEYLG